MLMKSDINKKKDTNEGVLLYFLDTLTIRRQEIIASAISNDDVENIS